MEKYAHNATYVMRENAHIQKGKFNLSEKNVNFPEKSLFYGILNSIFVFWEELDGNSFEMGF
jgi:hypothetical protein